MTETILPIRLRSLLLLLPQLPHQLPNQLPHPLPPLPQLPHQLPNQLLSLLLQLPLLYLLQPGKYTLVSKLTAYG